jgi:PAS domain S-box-containing protein
VERIAGFTVDERLKQSVAQMMTPESHARVTRALAEYVASERYSKAAPNRVLRIELEYYRKDGSTLWIEDQISSVRDASGALIGFRGVARDINERRQAEEKLRKSEERFRQITENMLDAVSLIDGKGIIQYASPSHQRILGYTSEDMVGKSVFEFIPPEDMEGLMASLEGLREKGEVTYQYRFRHSEGRYIWGEASAKAIRDDGGNVSGYMIASKDITDRKKAEELLKDSEAKYRRLFESTQTAIEVISAETGLVVLANEATARMFGFASPDNLVGLDSMAYLRPEDREWVAEGMAGALTDKSWHEIAELQVRTNDGRWLWISGMAIQSEYQGKPALLVSLLDITSRKQAEETLRQSE